MPISNDLNDLESQVKKSKISTASFLGKGSFASGQEIANIHKTIGNLAGHVRKTVIRVGALEKILANQSKKITSLKNISGLQGQQIRGTNIGAKLPGGSADNLDKTISTIADTVSSIAETLKAQKKTSGAASENERKKAEREKRGLAESKLEKAFGGIINAAQKIIAPVKSIIDRILDFIKTVILGRIIYKLVGWLGDPKNASKVKSIIRFVKDWWPTLLGAYIIFGTSFGRFTTKIIGMVARFAVQIATKAIPGLITLARRNPATAALALGTTTYLTNQTLNPPDKGGQEKQGFSGGGYARPSYRRGSLRRFFGLYGGGSPGYVSGAKGVDRIPAMLSDGEFVMSRGAVQMYGADTLSAMNAAGGGTNRPKIMGGTTYAQGGGLMGRAPNPDPNYKDPILDDRLNLIKSLERYARSQASAGGDGNLIKSLNDVALSLKGTSGSGGFMTNLYNTGMNEIGKIQSYFQGDRLQSNISKLMQAGTQYGAGLYDQALKVGNQALSDIQSGKFQEKIIQTGNNLAQTPQKAAGGFFDFMKNMSSSKRYKEGAARMEKAQDTMINFGDKFVKNLPDGPFKELADKGLIPIPSGNAKTMRNLTFLKAMLGPLGRPFKILSNKEVDMMRQKTIEKTMNKNGLIVDPKTGQVRMNWNQEDINKRARGGGAYTDDLGPNGAKFNSILGRFSASTEGKGNTLFTDDRYNFNKTVAEYADMAKRGMMKGSMNDAIYYGASMMGRFAQDIGWLNQRALGSKIEIGKVNRNKIDPTTGKLKTPQQIAAERARLAKSKPKTLPVKPPTRTTTVMQGQTAVTMYSKNDPRRKSTARPSTPRFSATTKGSKTKADLIGVHR